MNRPRLSTRGFTLIELLTVIAVIGLLLALLMPALSRARGSAERAQCISQLKQMMQATIHYAGLHDGRMPPAYRRDVSTGLTDAWDLSTVVRDGKPEVVPGLLWQGVGDARIQQCPSFHGQANWVLDPHSGYNYNSSYLGGFEIVRGNQVLGGMPSVTIDLIQQPSRCAVFGDGEWSGGANKFMRAPKSGPLDNGFSGRGAGTQGFRHHGQTNVAFADGHVQSLSERFASGFDAVPGDCGFLSQDNQLYDLE